jgi:hypothetical protein
MVYINAIKTIKDGGNIRLANTSPGILHVDKDTFATLSYSDQDASARLRVTHRILGYVQ